MDNGKHFSRLFPLKSRKRKKDGFAVPGAEHYLNQSMVESIAQASAVRQLHINEKKQNTERERQKKMGKNGYIAKRDAARQKLFEIACETTAQQFFDYLCIVLNDPDIMGKDVFGENRLRKLHDALKETDKYYSEAFVNSMESDYYQEKMDAELKRIFGEIAPFNERYPYMKEWNYNKKSGKG